MKVSLLAALFIVIGFVASFGATEIPTIYHIGTYQVGSGVIIDTRTGEIVCQYNEDDGNWYSTKTKSFGDRKRIRYAFRADEKN